jgi:site-specific recombinase XerD
MDLHELMERFLQSKTSQGRSQHTLIFYRRNINNFLKWCKREGYLGADLIGPTGAEVIEDYQRSMLDRGLSPFTVHSRYRALRALYHWVEKRDGSIEGGNPFVWLSEPQTPDTLPKAISYAEVTLLLHSIQGDDWVAQRDRLIIRLLFSTGMRAGELLGLNTEDIEIEQRRIHLFRTKTQTETYIPISHSLQCEFSAWLEHLPNIAPGILWPATVTPGTRDGIFQYDGLKMMLRRRCKRAGIKAYLPHSFRHGCAVHIIQRGGDISLVKELLGHRDLMTTQVYLRFDVAQLTSAYDKIFD